MWKVWTKSTMREKVEDWLYIVNNVTRLLPKGEWLRCLHIIINQDFQSKAASNASHRCRRMPRIMQFMSGCRENRSSPVESKRPKWEDYHPHPEDSTEYMLSFKLSPLLHLLFIPHQSLWVAPLLVKVKSLLFLFSWCSILWATPGPNLQIKGGVWRDEGVQGARLRGFVVKKRLGGWVQGNLRSRCLLVSMLKLVFVRRAGIQLEQIHDLIYHPRHSSSEKIPPWPADKQAGGWFFIFFFKAENCDDLQLKK